ncbi:MAG: MFS transporter [Thermodesulfobacteriota bacterium]|nr:MFS transporter [Thermodesulfobacteriota bacterium]
MSDLMEQKENSTQKFFYGWVITGLVSLNLAMAYGAQYSFGVLFPSLIEEFKWNRQSLSGAFSLYTFMYSVLGVLLGRWTDRFGPRIILFFGSAFLGMGIGLISLVNAPWHLYLVYGLLASWGMSATYITANPIIVKWFIAQRGLAVGLAQSGLGIGIIIIPPITGALIAALGWRPTCVILGASVFIVLCTTSFFLIGYPEKIGLMPDGRQKIRSGKSSSTARSEEVYEAIYKEVNWSVAEAIHTKSFWVLTALFFSSWLFVFLPLVHLVIFAMDIGLSRESALISLSILGGSSTLGRLIMGYISDRIGRKRALAVNFGLQVFTWFWIMGATTSWMLFLFAVIFGFSYGGVSAIFPAIIGDYFGRLKAASVIGAIFTLAGTAAAIGPLAGGGIYDLTRSYKLAFLCGALTNLLALTLLAFSKPPVKK